MDGNETPQLPSLLDQITEAKSIVEFDQVEAGLTELAAKYQGVVYEVQTAEGLAAAKAARLAIREVRFRVQNKAAAMKDPLNRFKKMIDTQAERIKAAVEKIEDPIHQQIKAEEDRQEAERERKRQEKLRRANEVNAKLRAISESVDAVVAAGPDEIAATRAEIAALSITPEGYDDQAGAAVVAQQDALRRLDALHAAAVQRAEHDKAIAAERAELARLREEQAARERAEAEQRERERAERAERERAEREERERAERERLEKQRAEIQRLLDEAKREKAEADAELAKARAEYEQFRAAKTPAPVTKPEPVTAPAPQAETTIAGWVVAPPPRPTDLQLIGAVAHAFGVSGQVALDWLYTLDFHAAQAAL